MNVEETEHALHQLNGGCVTVVRPNYGTQSDSWRGDIHTVENCYPLKFQFVAMGITILFTAEDVVKLENTNQSVFYLNNTGHTPIIRLKGPQHFENQTVS